jgi:hypothetical protein
MRKGGTIVKRIAALVAAMLLVRLVALSAEEIPLSPVLAGIAGAASRIDEALAAAPVQTKAFTRGQQSGVLSYYELNDGVGKLVVQLVSEQSGDVTEYYYNHGNLIYVVEACKNFSSPIRTGSLRDCKSISEDRYYLSDGALVGWLTGQGNGNLTLRRVRGTEEALVKKGKEVERVARLWRAFASSPMSDLLEFDSSLSSTTPPAP